MYLLLFVLGFLFEAGSLTLQVQLFFFLSFFLFLFFREEIHGPRKMHSNHVANYGATSRVLILPKLQQRTRVAGSTPELETFHLCLYPKVIATHTFWWEYL